MNTDYIDLVKIGEVSSIDPITGTCRVVFDDEDGVVSYDLPVLQRNTLKNHDYHMPDVNEDVIVLMRSGGLEDGIVIGSIYAGEVKPPESTEDRRTVVFADGTRACYDRKAHVLTITIDGTEIVFDRQCGSITVPSAVTVNCKTATVNASESVSINSPNTNVSGNLTVKGLLTGQGGLAISGGSGGASAKVTGKVEVTDDVVAGGVSLLNHTHKEQGDGAPTSPPIK